METPIIVVTGMKVFKQENQHEILFSRYNRIGIRIHEKIVLFFKENKMSAICQGWKVM